jgi:hypothetical protein
MLGIFLGWGKTSASLNVKTPENETPGPLWGESLPSHYLTYRSFTAGFIGNIISFRRLSLAP